MIIASADRFEAIAAGTRVGLEPALALAIDPLVPSKPLIDSLRALRDTFPDLPVSFSTEGVRFRLSLTGFLSLSIRLDGFDLDGEPDLHVES